MKISTVGFLNSAPLWWGLRAGRHPEGWEIAFDPPSVCARKLRTGEADLGLVPSIEFGRTPGLHSPVPLCVAARREVTSVLLFLGAPPEKLRRVSLDPASRTSQALTRLLLKRRFGVDPEYTETGGDPFPLEAGSAALVIGDRALALGRRWPGVPRIDLAESWNEQTGLPFVFAMWACRDPLEGKAASETLLNSHMYGSERIGEIAAEFSLRLGLKEEEIRRYLRENLHYEAGPRERESVDLFLSMCGEEGLLAGSKLQGGSDG